MKKGIYSIAFAIMVVILTSCGGSSARNVTKQFFDAVKAEKEDIMSELYPEVSKLSSYKKSDNITIKSTNAIDDGYEVVVENHFTTGFGKQIDSEITLYIHQNDNKKWVIYDSRGITSYDTGDNEKIYKFAQKTGCISERNLTDQQTAIGINRAYKLCAKLLSEIKDDLDSNCKIKTWSWDTSDYSGSASGKGIVQNNSNYNIGKLKYIVKYYDRSDNIITTDDGYVTYDVLESGSSTSFTFYTSYVGNAKTASVKLIFDDEWIIDAILSSSWSGKEYSQYSTKL